MKNKKVTIDFPSIFMAFSHIIKQSANKAKQALTGWRGLKPKPDISEVLTCRSK